jgi:hypothetical protein
MPRVLNYRHAVTQHVARRTRRWVDATPQPTHEPKAIDEGDGMCRWLPGSASKRREMSDGLKRRRFETSKIDGSMMGVCLVGSLASGGLGAG